MKMEMFVIVIVTIVFLCTYFFFNKAEIPIEDIQVSASNMISSLVVTSTISQVRTSTTLSLDVSFAIYIIAVFAWLGWYLRPLDRS